MTGAITWEAVTAMIVIFGAGAGVWYRLHGQAESVRRDLDAFKLEVAKSYATQHSIREVEERVVQAIDRLGDRLDRFLENRKGN